MPAQPNSDQDAIATYNSDGSRIARASWSGAGIVGRSQLWDALSGRELAVLAEGPERRLVDAFSPDGKRVVVGSGVDLSLWDAVVGRPLARSDPNAKSVWEVDYSPDGKRIAY